MKKLLALFLSFAIIFSLQTTVFAAETNGSLYSIADEKIQIVQNIQESGAVITTYSQLDSFVENVRNQFPAISDYEIASFILEYTNQCSEGMPESEVLLMLEYDNISTTTQYLKATEEGFLEISEEEALLSPFDTDTSNDGYMQLTTNFTQTGTSGSNKLFAVWTTAKWLKYPAIALEDVLALGTNGTFNSNYSEYGYVYQTFQCTSGCTTKTYRNRYVTSTNTVDEDLEMEYKGYTPYLRFLPISPRCDYCDGGSKDYSFTAYLRYGLITSDSCNVQAAYCHKTFGITGISMSIDSLGAPSFSVGAGTTKTDYIARAVTVS